MLTSAALVPDTALVVRGAGGRSDPGGALRAAAVRAVDDALVGAEAVVVVAPADAATRVGPLGHEVVGSVRASLVAAGVPEHVSGARTWRAGRREPAPDGTPDAGEDVGDLRAGVATTVALDLLDAAAWSREVRIVEVPRPGTHAGAVDEVDGWDRWGAELVAGPDRVALVVVGSGSGRHGPDAPLADDPDALAADDAIVGALSAGDPEAVRAALGAVDADRLAISGRGPWLVLAGAAGRAGAAVRTRRVTGRASAHVLAGALHVVGTWRVGA